MDREVTTPIVGPCAKSNVNSLSRNILSDPQGHNQQVLRYEQAMYKRDIPGWMPHVPNLKLDHQPAMISICFMVLSRNIFGTYDNALK